MASRTRSARPGLRASPYSQLAYATNGAGCIETDEGRTNPAGLVSGGRTTRLRLRAARTSRIRREVGSRSQPICHNPPYDLASAIPGTFAIAPVKGKVDALKRDYANTTAMIFGTAPEFDEIAVRYKRSTNNLRLSICPRHRLYVSLSLSIRSFDPLTPLDYQ
jgi:hypothetical protein